jgi:hypothetical protein
MTLMISKAITKYFRKQYGGLASVEFLRQAVQFFDHRQEYLNEKKSVDHLLQDFVKDLEKEYGKL